MAARHQQTGESFQLSHEVENDWAYGSLMIIWFSSQVSHMQS